MNYYNNSSLYGIYSSVFGSYIILIHLHGFIVISYNITTNEHTPLKIHMVKLPLLRYHKLQIRHFLILSVINCTVAVEEVVKFSSCVYEQSCQVCLSFGFVQVMLSVVN